MTSHDWRPGSGNPEEEELQRLAAMYIDRLIAGEKIKPLEIIANHPEWGERILEELETFTRIGVSADADPLGTLGDYTLRRQIGRGGMGVVYEAWQASLDRQVALKVLPAGIAADDRAFHRFMREAKTAAKLSHPNVVGVHSVGLEKDTPYYAMEFVEGETLAKILVRTKDAESETDTPFGTKDSVVYFGKLAEAFADVADGLQHAHSKGVTHRDIKPSNLILDQDGRLRILDFGLARLEGQESLTLSGDFVGTPLYMSPEQARRKKIPVDHRTDVYSLGATMYEAICGRPPFRGKDHADTLSQIIERDPVEPRKVNPRVPKDLETIVLKCLRKEPGHRYGTAEALGQDLRRFVRGDAIEARPRSGWEKVVPRLWRYRVQAAVVVVVVALLVLLSLSIVKQQRAIVKQQRDAYRLRQANYRTDMLDAVARLQVPGRLSTKVGAATPTPRRYATPLFTFLMEGSRTLESKSSVMAPVETAVKTLGELAAGLPDRPEAYYHRARGWLLLGREDLALKDLEMAIACDGGFVPAVLLKAEVLEGLENGGEARREREKLAHPARDGWAEAFIRARRAMDEGEWLEAAEAYTQLLDLEVRGGEHYAGSTVETYLHRGLAYLQDGQISQAIEDFSVAREGWRGSPEPVLLLAEAYHLSEDPQQATRCLRDFFRRTRFKNEAALGISVLYGSYLGDPETALQWTEHIQDEFLRERTRIMHLVVLNDFPEAIKAGERALQLRPEDASVYSRLGVAYAWSGSKEKALEVYERAVRLDPGIAHSHFGLGHQLLFRGRVEEAIEHLKVAVDLADSPQTRAHLARAFHLNGEDGAALRQFRAGLTLVSKSTRKKHYLEAALHWWYGKFLEFQRRFPEALTQYTKAIAIRPGKSAHFYGKITERTRRILDREPPAVYGEALGELIDVLEEVLEEEASPRILKTLALACMSHTRDEIAARALDYAQRAVRGEDPEAHAILAKAQARSGDPARAVTSLETALCLPGADLSLELILADYRARLFPENRSHMWPLVPEDAIWKFYKGRKGPSEALEWTLPEFPEDGWEQGPGGFGYGLEHPYRTWLHDMPGSYTTLYTRHTFRVRDPETIQRLLLYVWTSDDFTAYLNGQEVKREGAGSPGVRISQKGTANASANANVPYLVTIDAAHLRTGENCVAIQGMNGALRQHEFYLHALLAGESEAGPQNRQSAARGGKK